MIRIECYNLNNCVWKGPTLLARGHNSQWGLMGSNRENSTKHRNFTKMSRDPDTPILRVFISKGSPVSVQNLKTLNEKKKVCENGH